MSDRRLLACLALLALGLSFAFRAINHQRTRPLAQDAGAGTWLASDPDGLYHMRRVERSLDGGLPVAAFDPYLAFPAPRAAGTPVPWPPYYTLALHGLLAPFAPADPVARRSFVERAVATWPAVFSALTSALLALGAAGLVRASCRGDDARATGAALLAGTVAAVSHALAFAALRYSFVGNGDHHAFVALVYSGLLLGTSLALRTRTLADAPRAVFHGTLCGLLVGFLLGTWVASLELLALLELALLGAWVLGPASALRGLAAFGATLHGAATLVLLPAVVGSPWAILSPLAVVELTWVHPALLMGGFLFFACAPVARALREIARRSPWIGVLFPLALVVLVLRSPLRGSLEEAFVWARGGGPFMAFTNESRPLVSAAQGAAPLLKFLGYTAPVALVGWGLALRALRRGAVQWAPCVVAFPVLLVQAALNRRFAELVLPSQVLLLGLCAAHFWQRARGVRARRLVLAFAVLAAAAAHPATLRASVARLAAGARPETPELLRVRGERQLLAWLRERTPAPEDPPSYGVLAQWDLGHAIVWAGGRPVVATNFGAYLGLDSYLDPWRFFLEPSEEAAEDLLARRRADYVIVTSRFRRNLHTMLSVLHPGELEAWFKGLGGRAPLWLEGIGARLLAQMGGPLPASPTRTGGLGFLRLVYLSPDRHRDPERSGVFGPAPLGAVFERVAGARVRVQGEPGDVLRASLRLRYPGVDSERLWRASATVGADGWALLRVPYSTDGEQGGNGDGLASAALDWSLGARRGEVVVSEAAVRTGAVVEIP